MYIACFHILFTRVISQSYMHFLFSNFCVTLFSPFSHINGTQQFLKYYSDNCVASYLVRENG